ncbi:MAG: ribonuclease P protein component [Thermomonas sp.]
MTSAAPRARLASFPKTARLRQRAEFSRVFEAGRRVAAPAMSVHWIDATQPRLGVAVSRKVDPNAVGRNRIKRVLRDAFRNHCTQLQPADYVVVARAPAATLDNASLRKVFLETLQRAGALPPPSPAGTMRPACTLASPTPSMPEPPSG